MLPALTTKPKQAVRQVKGLTNDSIDSYSNTPLGGGTTYTDNTESGNGTPRASPPATGRPTINSGRAKPAPATGEEGVMARVVRDRKASGEEELSLRTGDVVKVLSSKRTGYLKCEAGDEVGYVPSSYLEFLDNAVEAENTTSNSNGNATTEDTQRAAEKHRKKHKKEKRKKEKRDVNDASDPEEAAPVTVRSPRNVEDESNESPRKKKKKERKHRDREAGEDTPRAGAPAAEEPSTARSRHASEDTERSRTRSKHSKKKRHRNVDSSDSSESDGGRTRSSRHGRHRRHRRGSVDSDSSSTSSGDSDGSYRRRRRRRRHRHRRSSSEEEDEDDSDHKRRSRRSKKRRDKDDEGSEPEEGSRTARKAEKKKVAETLQAVEKGVSQLDVKAEEKLPEAKPTPPASKKEEPDRDRDRLKETDRSEGSSEGRATQVSSSRKDDEGRTGSNASASKQNSTKAGLGRQIGEKMRSFLGGGSKKSHNSKNSSGILNACPGTVQGEEGWYEHGENERYYFVLVDGKWSLLYGPMTEEDFETFSNRVSEQNRAIELPPTYLHKSGYYLSQELRVKKEQ